MRLSNDARILLKSGVGHGDGHFFIGLPLVEGQGEFEAIGSPNIVRACFHHDRGMLLVEPDAVLSLRGGGVWIGSTTVCAGPGSVLEFLSPDDITSFDFLKGTHSWTGEGVVSVTGKDALIVFPDVVIDANLTGVLSGGTWCVEPGAVIRMPEAIHTLAGGIVKGDGASSPDLQLSMNSAIFVPTGTFLPPSDLTNSGWIQIPVGGRLEGPGDVENTGGGRISTGGGDVDVEGDIINELPDDIVETGLVIGSPAGAGAGTYACRTLDNNGRVRPGGEGGAGPFPLTGDFLQRAGGVLEIELGGLVPGDQHDRMQVDGAVTLGGTLDLSLLPGFEPQAGDAFTVMTVTNGAITGVFDVFDCGEGFDIEYQPQAVLVTFTGSACPADADCSGDVAFGDVLRILAAWGPYDPCPPFRP